MFSLGPERDFKSSHAAIHITQLNFHTLFTLLSPPFQAGMIRTEQEEFFIEPVERGDGVIEEEEGGEGRTHIVYRSSAVKKAPINSTAADYHSRGRSVAPTVKSSNLYPRFTHNSIFSFKCKLHSRTR